MEGTNLKLHMVRKRLSTAEIVAIALKITEALEAAHAAGIVHRDIKPGNIIVNSAGHVKVLDFGLARRFMVPATGAVTDSTAASPIGGSTIPGRPVGTANYMEPERILQLQLDPRSDLFSLGVVIYEMATGRLPFGGASPSETVTNILEKDTIPLTQLSSAHPLQLERVVNQLLAKRAEDRYQSAARSGRTCCRSNAASSDRFLAACSIGRSASDATRAPVPGCHRASSRAPDRADR